MGADTLIGGTGNDSLYLGAEDGVVDIVKYAFGDGADTVYQFVRGVGGDQIQFTGITNIDVVTSILVILYCVWVMILLVTLILLQVSY
ncbi:MAG: hypothetical protein ACYTXC_29150 [Nostoc sp.]